MAGRFETHPQWGEVLVEEATDAPSQARLARHAEALGRARHPGVAELLEYHDEGFHGRLLVRAPGTRTLADLPALPTDQVATVGAALAQTLADLHRLGISHGSLSPQVVLLTPLGQPVLRGFGTAGLLHPPQGEPEAFDPAGDLEALADLLESLLAPTDTESRRGASLVSLLHNTNDSSMTRLAADLAKMAAPARPPLLAEQPPPDPLDWTEDATREFWPAPPLSKPVELSRRTGRRAVLGALLAVVAIAAGALTVAALGGPGRPTAAQAAPSDVPNSADTGPSAPPHQAPGAPPNAEQFGSQPAVPPAPAPAAPTSQPSTPAPPSSAARSATCPSSHDEAAAVGIPAPCASQVTSQGNEVRLGTLAWSIGGPGDLAVAGDFDCDGWLDVAGLATGTGDVVLFDRWAGAGQEPTGRVVQRVPTAATLEAKPAGACHVLVAHPTAGAPVTIDIRKPR